MQAIYIKKYEFNDSYHIFFSDIDSFLKIHQYFKENFTNQKILFSVIVNDKLGLHNIKFKYFFKKIIIKFIEYENPKIFLNLKVFH